MNDSFDGLNAAGVSVSCFVEMIPLKRLFREIVVAQSMFLPEETSNLLENRTKTLPLHPNIVRMVAAFADRVPSFSDSMDLYPAALPKR